MLNQPASKKDELEKPDSKDVVIEIERKYKEKRS
jgi:hypothetical protein